MKGQALGKAGEVSVSLRRVNYPLVLLKAACKTETGLHVGSVCGLVCNTTSTRAAQPFLPGVQGTRLT